MNINNLLAIIWIFSTVIIIVALSVTKSLEAVSVLMFPSALTAFYVFNTVLNKNEE